MDDNALRHDDAETEADALRARAIEMLDVLELDTRETNIQHMMVFIEAFSLFVQRNAMYGDLWREYGASDNLMHMRSKLARTEITHRKWLEGGEDMPDTDSVLDSPLDLINYCTFFIRNMRGT